MRRGFRRVWIALCVTSLFAGGFWSCLSDTRFDARVEGPSTETGNPSLAGLVRDASGQALPGVSVTLYRTGIEGLPDTAPGPLDTWRAPIRWRTVISAADGSFRFDSLPAGTYALEGRDTLTRRAVFKPDIRRDSGQSTRRDTLILRTVSRITGMARRAGFTYPAGVRAHENILVRILGTPLATYTDTTGRYTLDAVPTGTYSLGFAAADGHYLPARLDSIAVPAGGVVTPYDVWLEWSPFIGEPPTPAGMRMDVDTLQVAGMTTVSLSWRPVRVSNFSHYLVTRWNSEGVLERAHVTTDTLWAETLATAGRGGVSGTLPIDPTSDLDAYRLAAVDSLGNSSHWADFKPPQTQPPQTVPQPMDSRRPTLGRLSFLTLLDALPVMSQVWLYAVDTKPAPPDSLPRHAQLLDSSVIRGSKDTEGTVVFADLPIMPSLSYTVIAKTGAAGCAALLDAKPTPQAGSGAAAHTDTLHLKPPSVLRGKVIRQGIWCSTSTKMNENIEVSLAGTPWWTVTDFSGQFSLAGIAPGTYRMVTQALPVGCFMPDTQSVTVAPGDTLNLPEKLAQPNTGFIPRISDLNLISHSRDTVTLMWTPVSPAFEATPQYEVWRSVNGGAYLAASARLTQSQWSENLANWPIGTSLAYAVRVVAQDGRRGALAGNREGLPVTWIVGD